MVLGDGELLLTHGIAIFCSCAEILKHVNVCQKGLAYGWGVSIQLFVVRMPSHVIATITIQIQQA